MDTIEIPTLPDLARGIERWMAGEATGEESTEALHAEVNHVLDQPGANPDHLFKLIAFGLGCHTVSYDCRDRDDFSNAIIFHFMGQCMLEKAVKVLAEIAAGDMRRIGEKRH